MSAVSSSPNSTQDKAQQLMAATVFAADVEIDPTQIEKLTNLQVYTTYSSPVCSPTASLLSILQQELPELRSFTLSAAQEAYIDSLFTKWHLDNEICLIDLLGLELHQQFEKLCVSTELKESILDEFHLTMMQIYALFVREKSPSALEEKRFRDFYFNTKDQLSTSLQRLAKDLERSKKEATAGRQNLWPMIDRLLSPLKQGIALFRHILASDCAATLLITENLMHWPRSTSLNEFNENTLTHLRSFAAYASALCEIVSKKKLAIRPISLVEMLAELKKTPKSLLDFPKKLNKSIQNQAQISRYYRGTADRARSGELTHDQWLKETGIAARSSYRKPRLEFVESLSQQFCFWAIAYTSLALMCCEF